MAWSSLKNRLTSLPLLIAGPIVRRTEASNVSIWFVLKENRNVTLNIYDQNTGGIPVLSGNRNSGVGIGDHVFVYCVTASKSGSGFTLSSATNYYYDIDFGNGTTLSGLISDKDKKLDLTFDGSNRPSFALPPDDLNQVRLIHGSCRKPHGEGYDAMEGVHDMILESVSDPPVTFIDPIKRPHQLFLTGDQIYADDVADVMLFMIDDAASVLFGWNENYAPFTEDELRPGRRNTNDRIRNEVGFTGMIPKKPDYSKSHLLKFREYATMYLFVWSDTLWPNDTDFPGYTEIHPNGKYKEVEKTENGKKTKTQEVALSYFLNEINFVRIFKSTIAKVRKALANIPTFMIFDDHEITDDWNLNWHWCKEVYSKSLGRRTVQNGLLAYALFQAWGNTPDQFNQIDKKKLLDAASKWRGEEDADFAIINNMLNIPTSIADEIKDFPHEVGTIIDWHFFVELSNYSVYALDSRTYRGFPRTFQSNEEIAFAKLISQTGYENQLPRKFPAKGIILIIAPCPVIGVPFIEDNQKKKVTWAEKLEGDTEAWSLDQDGFERLFSNLVNRLPESEASKQRMGKFAFLSGDVHYGLSARYQLWGNRFLNDNHNSVDTQAIFAQLTASAFKNQTHFTPSIEGVVTTQVLHEHGYIHGKLEGLTSLTVLETQSLPNPFLVFGWIIDKANPYIGERIRNEMSISKFPYPKRNNGLFIRSLAELQNDLVSKITVKPDWRYRIDWMLGRGAEINSHGIAEPKKILVPPSLDSRKNAIQDYLAGAKNHSLYTKTWGAGKEIVGVNTLGEIRFNFNGLNEQINHIMWWRMESVISDSTPLKLFPLTTFTIPINYIGDSDHNDKPYSKPEYPSFLDL